MSRNTLTVSVAIIVLVQCCLSVDSDCKSNVSSIFISDLVFNVSQGETVPVSLLQKFIPFPVGQNKTSISHCSSALLSAEERRKCVLNHCLPIDSVLKLYSLQTNQSLSIDDVYTIAPALLFHKVVCDGIKDVHGSEEHKINPSSVQAWGFGFLFVTIINVCSLSGAVVLPCMKRDFYQKVLIFMVSLAVGSLCASGLLVLIPEALGLMYTEDHEISEMYIWKSTTVIAGIYLFFLIERFLKIVLKVRQKSTHNHGHEYYEIPYETNDEEGQYPSIKRNTPVNISVKYKDTKNLPIKTLRMSKSESSFSSRKPLEDNSASMASLDTLDQDKSGLSNGHTSSELSSAEKKEVATVAWMIIFGDGLHNFIDGLTIGAAFTESILAGISICVAVFCEELPHELGDFAILLNSGMTVKKALMYNFLSACMCYLGLVVGTLLGENTSAHDWVFAIAGGMFLYISLVDMMPEMNSAAESEENKVNIGPLRIFIIQNVGLVCGFGVILIMAIYGGEINFEK